MSASMKVMLIFPSTEDYFAKDSFCCGLVRPLVGLGGSNIIPPLSLLMIAAVTPPDVEVKFVDERVEPINYDENVDIVGISVVTKAAPKAYQIADEFKKRGVTVVLGGIHPTVLPQEAISHADAIVIGEGEKVWPQLLEHYKQGQLKRYYFGGHQTAVEGLPWPRREIIHQPERYVHVNAVAATRGCENSCTFCSNGLALGKQYRKRRVADVVSEISSLPSRVVYFVDDNLGWDINYAKALLRALIPLDIKWTGMFTLSALEDEELVELAAKSGCITINLGFESLSPQVIKAIKKERTNNPERYQALISRVHSYGIPIFGNFIVGFDDDGKDVFEKLADFINKNAIEMPSVNILIPYPGTSIYRQLEKEGRLLHKRWEYYDDRAPYVVYRPKQMTVEELLEGYIWLIKEIHSLGATVRRCILSGNLLSVSTPVALFYNSRRLSGTLKAYDAAQGSIAV